MTKEKIDVRLEFDQDHEVYFHTHVGTFDNGMEVSRRVQCTTYLVRLDGKTIAVDILPVLEKAALILKQLNVSQESEASNE